MTSTIYENSLSTISSLTGLYERGKPFHKLTKLEATPSMNLYKTFNAYKPNVMDFLKDSDFNQWTDPITESFLILLSDVEAFAKAREFDDCQTGALLELFYSCFQYFILLPAISKDQLSKYFRETLLLYSVNDPPDALRIFTSINGFAIAKLFQNLVVNNFEMMKYVLVPAYEIEVPKD